MRYCLILTSLLAASFSAASATAAPLTFDCDTAVNNLSSVSSELVTPLLVSGEIEAISLRTGDYQPLAGATISTDNDDIFGFQVAAASTDAERLDVYFNVKRSGKSKRTSVGQLPAKAIIPFTLRLGQDGKALFEIGGSSFQADLAPSAKGRLKVFCSTREFKFSGLTLQ